MAQWEYCTLEFLQEGNNWRVSLIICDQAETHEQVSGLVETDQYRDRSSKLLSLLGKDRWELVTVHETTSRRIFYFKRPLMNPEVTQPAPTARPLKEVQGATPERQRTWPGKFWSRRSSSDGSEAGMP